MPGGHWPPAAQGMIAGFKRLDPAKIPEASPPALTGGDNGQDARPPVLAGANAIPLASGPGTSALSSAAGPKAKAPVLTERPIPDLQPSQEFKEAFDLRKHHDGWSPSPSERMGVTQRSWK